MTLISTNYERVAGRGRPILDFKLEAQGWRQKQSTDSADDSVAYDQVKTALSESQAEAEE